MNEKVSGMQVNSLKYIFTECKQLFFSRKVLHKIEYQSF